MSLAAAAHQGWSANLITTPSDMFPRSSVGSVSGIGFMAGSIGAMLLATYAGYVLQTTHNYASLFVIASVFIPRGRFIARNRFSMDLLPHLWLNLGCRVVLAQ